MSKNVLKLQTGKEMPLVGLGCWKIEKGNASDVVYKSLQLGYKLIDSACDYGNEKEVGEGIQRALKDDVIKREDLFVTSKLWNTYHRKEHVRDACIKTLTDLKLDYLDLYLIHFPISQKFVPFETRYPPEWLYDPEAKDPKVVEDLVPYRETWEALEALVDEGLCRQIGFCNIGTTMIRDVLSYAKVGPSVLQVELHPQNTQQKLLRFCKEKGIAVTAFSSFGGTSYSADKSELLLENEIVHEIGKNHGKSAAQVLLRFGIQRDTAVIPKSSNESRLAENIDIFDFELSEEEMKQLNDLNENKRFNDPGVFCEAAFQSFYPIYE